MTHDDNLKTRTFICIDFPSSVIKEVARIQSLVEKQNFTGKLTELENLHLTLKFLGHINSKTLENIKHSLTKIKFPTLNLKLSHSGTFNFRGNPKIVWLKVNGNIFKLQKTIDESLCKQIKPEERFMSHLTIARIKHVKDKKSFINYINHIKPQPLQFQIDKFKLKSSSLQQQGPIYTTLENYKLQ